MNPRFKKLTLATAVAAGMAGVSQPSQAVIGALGEAQLVPLVVWDSASANPNVQNFGDVNTVIEITVPNVVGWEDVANIYTAPHTTPTNPVVGPGALLFPDDQDLVPSNSLWWYWFDHRSVKKLDREVKVTPDDMVQINWRQAAGGAFRGQPGYMVIGTKAARTGAAADFAFFADAHLLIAAFADDNLVTPYLGQTFTASIPVLALNDGPDGPFGTPVTNLDNVKYSGGGVPREVSPLISGMRSNLNDDALDDVLVFDLTLSHRLLDTLHVIWVDRNLDQIPNYDENLLVEVFDTDELSCSGTIKVPNELNLVYVPGNSAYDGVVDGSGNPFRPGAREFDAWWTHAGQPWVTEADLCFPFAGDVAQTLEAGFVKYYMPEYLDADPDTDGGAYTGPESSIYAFALKLDYIPAPTLTGGVPILGTSWLPSYVNVGVALGHDRGMFND